MSGYVVLKSKQTDDGWEHEAIAWCAWEDAANAIVKRQGNTFSVRYGYVKYNVVKWTEEPPIIAISGREMMPYETGISMKEKELVGNG